ncbi:MAG TPA: HlyD family efflux transporter periplasmic adaptor subunit [Steroidobacteraceae bacterium]|nr:HlyD family efflux transporter periplasmic adaptor subunit [Steroidobacteraceae bacterium]
MKIAHLKSLSDSRPEPLGPMRGTEGQDTALTTRRPIWRKYSSVYAGAAAAVLLVALFAWLVHAWSQSQYTVSAERLRIAEVGRGRFVRDVAAEGSVVAPVSPTLFAIAPGTVSYTVHAGDAVKKGQVLAVIDSPELKNEYLRERATLESLDAGIAHQEIEVRQQLLTSQQQADLAHVSIKAAERELKRNQAAWELKVIPERDFQKAQDEVATAKLNFEHARASAKLDQASVVLDLRTRRLERDRQALVVQDLKRRLEELNVRSPVDGMVANLGQQEKAEVPENAPLLTVVDLTALEIEFRVAESYASDIRAGMGADITLGGATDRGVVTAISPQVKDNEVIGRVKFAHKQPAGLRQNQRASVRIVLDDRPDVLKFERGPLIDEATRAVYLVKGNRAIRVPVTLGPASVAEIEVDRGLQPGDRVIVSDTRDFNDAPQLLIGR